MADEDFTSFLKETGLPSGADIKKERTEAFEKHKAERAPLLKQSDELMAKMTELNEKMATIKTPAAPKLESLDKPPDAHYRDPTQALGSLASVIAMLGSMKTRAPLTAALNSASGAMIGFHQGDKERVSLERQKWEDNLTRGLQQNQIELQKYGAALQESHFDLAKAQNAFRLIAAENDHTAMKTAIEAQDYEAQMSILDGSLKAGLEAAKLFSTHKDRQAQIEATKAYREAALAARGTDKTRAESWKARNELQKRVGPIDKSISDLDSASVLLHGSSPGEKIEGARVLQKLLGGSQRLKADVTQMGNFGDIVTRIEGFLSKGIWGELTDAQYQQLLSGVKNLREKETARRKAAEQDIRNLVTSGELDPAIVFGENQEAEPAPSPAAPGGGGTRDLDYFLGKRR